MDGSYTDAIKAADRKVIGIKQTLLYLASDSCETVFVALDCDDEFKRRIMTAAKGKDVRVIQHFTRQHLGRIAGVDVPAGVVSVLKDTAVTVSRRPRS